MVRQREAFPRHGQDRRQDRRLHRREAPSPQGQEGHQEGLTLERGSVTRILFFAKRKAMPLKYRFTLGVFAGAFLGTYIEARRLVKHNNELIHKYNLLLDRHEKAVKLWASQYQAALYLLNVLEKHDIDLTEFDLIALKNIIQPKQA